MTHNGKIVWTNEKRRLGDLIPWEINPAQIGKREAERLEESLDEFGQVQTIAISPENEIYDGHQRKVVWSVSKKFGADYVVDVRVSSRPLTEQERKKLVIYLRKGAVGEFDWDILANNWEVDDLLEWGFTEKELEIGGFDLDGDKPEDPGEQIDRAEELREKWGVEPGQTWILGDHWIECGDSTDSEVIDRMCGDNDIDMVWSDPPFGKGGYAGRGGKLDAVQGDDADDETIEEFYLVGDAPEVYVCCDWETYYHLLASRGKPRSLIVWAKQVFGMGRGYRRQHEFIGYYGEFDSTTESDLWNIDRGGGYIHPTQKPVELPERAIKNSTNPGDIVLDPFLGSGTTLIACERLGRKCRAVEISPAYCAVAIQRWVDMTGGTPVILDGTG